MELQPKVSAKLLSNNVKRLTTATEPYTYYFKRVRDIQRWTHPSETALILLVYIGACYYQVKSVYFLDSSACAAHLFSGALNHVAHFRPLFVVGDRTTVASASGYRLAVVAVFPRLSAAHWLHEEAGGREGHN